jgi:enterochelin esterase-like enzyme
VDVVDSRTPVRLFEPDRDAPRLAFTRIGDAGRRGLFRVAHSTTTGRPVFHLELPVDSSGAGPDDYTASLVIKDRIGARKETIAGLDSVLVRLRGVGPRQTVHLTLMEDDGTSWTAAIAADSGWVERSLPLGAFRIGRGVKLPQGFPGQWSYWLGPAAGRGGAGDRIRLERLERIQISLRREPGVTLRPGNYGVEIESITLRGGGAAATAPEASEGCCTLTLQVQVPEGTGPLYLAGNLPQLGPWRPDGLRLEGDARSRTTRVKAPAGTNFEYKFTLGSWDREALSGAGTVPPNHRLSVSRDTTVIHEVTFFKRDPRDYIADWRGSGVRGRLVYWTDVSSVHLKPTRHVEIWLPPGYDSSSTRYPVIYMSDGQNLFDPRIANTGIDWGVDESVVRLVERRAISPVIVVGVWSTAERGPEYSPWEGANRYARFLIEELMPRVDREFRTLTGPANTAVIGSSMGGLLSFYLVTRHPDRFGACGCISTHFPLSEAVVASFSPGSVTSATPDTVPYITRDIASGLKAPPQARYWFDYGTEGIDAAYEPTHHQVRDWLRRQGRVEGRDFVVRRYEGATHNEAAWRARLDDVLIFLFGWNRG